MVFATDPTSELLATYPAFLRETLNKCSYNVCVHQLLGVHGREAV